jgi:H+/Cl- antiporter ClcA
VRMRLLPPFSLVRWQTRLVLWLSAAAAGLAVVGFARLADLALGTFFAATDGRPWLPFLLAPSIGMATVWLTNRYFEGAQGSGIPQVIAARRHAAQGLPVSPLVSLRIALGKVFLGAAALAGGFSAGREGPSVQIAASLVHFAHRFLPHAQALSAPDLILAGGAAGIAAAFNTPLAGIVFAIEELGRRLEARTSGVLVITIIVSGLVAVALQGNYNYFGHLAVPEADRRLVLPVIGCGIVCGLLGGAFSQLLLWPQKAAHWGLWRWRARHPVLFAGSCGLLVALLGWAGGGLSYGSGYSITAHVVADQSVMPWHAPLTRFAATVVTYFSGIPGGIFAPCLAVGAALGSYAQGLVDVAALPLITLCMAGFLAAVTQAPITSAIIVMEMIDGHGMVISLMAVALLGKAVSARLGPPLYQQLAIGFQRDPAP